MAVASWPHAAAMSRPRVSRTVAGTRAASSSALKAAIAVREDPSNIPVGLYGMRFTLKASRPRSEASRRACAGESLTPASITYSTNTRRFVDEVTEPIRLALSIHAADPGLRSELMPVNDRYPLADVLAECRRYVELRRRKVYVEYVMLAGVNDSPADARALAAVLDGRSFKVNLIPYNPIPAQDRHLRAQMPIAPGNAGGLYDGSSREAIERFKSVLGRARIPATVRLTRGRDIEAACGQLASMG